MDDLSVPRPLDMFAQESVCHDTTGGWLWYCDEHDSHGNADSEGEARAVAAAHTDFQDHYGDGPCEVVVWQRTRHERLG